MSDPRPKPPTPSTAGNDRPTNDEPRRPRRRSGQSPDEPATPGRPIPTSPIATERERQEQRLRERADEIVHGHWIVLMCPRGHENQRHRGSPAEMEGGGIRCVVCGQPCIRETPATTALREHRVATSTMALARNIVDRLSDWAQAHLDATTWTQQSEARRQELLRQDPTRGDGSNPFSL